MIKVLRVALREFIATVATKGFIIGVLITPLLIGFAIIVVPLIWNEEAPEIKGELALIDPTDAVAAGVRDYLVPEAIAERRQATKRKVVEQTPEQVREMAGTARSAVAEAALDAALGGVPVIRVVTLPPDADLEAEKAPLRSPKDEEGGRLALAVVHADAVELAFGNDRFGNYDLFVRGKLDDRISEEIEDALRHAIVGARIERRGLDRSDIEALTRVGRVRSTTVTDEGESETNEVLNVMLPAAFMVLLLVSVMSSGQYIMTTTIEEKSSRVVEVILSAVSPMQLMAGKIIGQMAVGLLILGLYSGMGIAALITFTLMGMVDPWLFFYLIVFYVIAYFIMGSFMAAIGAAVNEMREAQTLMMPVMMIVMIPWILWMPITRDPNGTFATVASFVPPVNNFVMLLRMSSTSPPPLWQVWLSIAVGVVTAYGALWFAAKVFRVGLLMFGKPPNFTTLIKWVRMA